MICARLAGIEVFATGGIGGVHRGAESTLDISADLEELAQTPVTVVASGAKAILDLPKTLEVLETRGVPVIAVGQDTLPAFWSRDSGLPAPLRLDDPAAIARAHRMRARLGLPGGQLVANPIPPEAEIPAATMAPHIAAALAAAEAEGIAAKAVTPFLLARIGEATGGAALAANIALVRANARLAARIADRARRTSGLEGSAHTQTSATGVRHACRTMRLSLDGSAPQAAAGTAKKTSTGERHRARRLSPTTTPTSVARYLTSEMRPFR